MFSLSQGWLDGSVDEGACSQTWWAQFNPENSHGRGKELITKNCKAAHWPPHVCTHNNTYIHTCDFLKKISWSCIWTLNSYYVFICLFVLCVFLCLDSGVVIRGKLSGIDFLFLPYGFWGPNSSCLAQQQAPLSSEPPQQPSVIYLFRKCLDMCLMGL